MDAADVGRSETAPFVVEDAELAVALETVQVDVRHWRQRHAAQR